MWDKVPEWLLKADLQAWMAIHVNGHTAFLDWLIPFFRNENLWAPLYIFLLVYVTLNFKKAGWVWCVLFFAAFACSDHLNSAILKPYFHRIRPCNTPELQGILQLLVPCGGGLSFPSSHAANHFAMGIFSAITLSKNLKYAWVFFILWAMLVSYAQVYVGVHFPLDVLAGAVVGGTIGALFAILFHLRFKLRKPALPATDAVEVHNQ